MRHASHYIPAAVRKQTTLRLFASIKELIGHLHLLILSRVHRVHITSSNESRSSFFLVND